MCDGTAVTAGFMRSHERAICTQMYLRLLICLIQALNVLKVDHMVKCIQRGPAYMVSMLVVKCRMERNRQRKREALWNLRVNGRGTLGLLKYDRPRQRRTFCNAMCLLLSVSSHWQVHWECFLIHCHVGHPAHTYESNEKHYLSKQRLQDLGYSKTILTFR